MQYDTPTEELPFSPRPQSGLLELAKRLTSGVVLAATALGLAYAGLLPFAGLVLVVALLVSWEWARIVRGVTFDLTLIIHGLAAAAATALAAFGYAGLGVAMVLIGAIIVLPLEFGRRPIMSALGVPYSGLPAVALLWIRGNEPMGFRAVLYICLIVAVTDTAAFAIGRLVGGPRLAPRISPNKTWSGLIGGLGAATLAGAAFAVWTDGAVLKLALTGFLLGLVAQVGDLSESALKRTFGVKDASNLLPGHGGFMDRVDGIVAAAVAAAVAALFLDPHAPATALLSAL